MTSRLAGAMLCLQLPAIAMAQDAVQAPRPTAPYVVSACPFECCVYGTWRFLTSADVRSEPLPAAPVVAMIRAGQSVRATRGQVRMDTLGIVLVRRDFRDEHFRNDYRAGDTLLVLDYVGEGYSRVWVRGERRMLDLSFVLSEHGPPVGRDSAAMVELRAPARQWWAQVTLPVPVAKDSGARPAARTGWVHMTPEIDVRGADACGVDSPSHGNSTTEDTEVARRSLAAGSL